MSIKRDMTHGKKHDLIIIIVCWNYLPKIFKTCIIVNQVMYHSDKITKLPLLAHRTLLCVQVVKIVFSYLYIPGLDSDWKTFLINHLGRRMLPSYHRTIFLYRLVALWIKISKLYNILVGNTFLFTPPSSCWLLDLVVRFVYQLFQ